MDTGRGHRRCYCAACRTGVACTRPSSTTALFSTTATCGCLRAGAATYGAGVTSLPVWAVYCVSFGTPLAAFVGVLVGQLITRRGAAELDRRAKREETMRTLRWASECAVSADVGSARLGLAALDALSASPWLQPEDQMFVDAVVEAIVETAESAYLESGGAAVALVSDTPEHGMAADAIDQEDSR